MLGALKSQLNGAEWMRLVKGSLEPSQEVWKFGAVAGVAGAGTRGGMPDGPGVVEMEGIAGYQG